MNRRNVLRIMAIVPLLAACPILIGTPPLPPIEGLRVRRRNDGNLEVRWQRSGSLGVSTHTVIKVLPAAPGPCTSIHVPHSANLNVQTVPDLTGQDLFVAASLMRGSEYISVPAIVFLSKWARSAGYAEGEGKDDDRDRSYGVFGKGPVIGNDSDGPLPGTDNEGPDLPMKPNPQPTPRPRDRGPQCQ